VLLHGCASWLRSLRDYRRTTGSAVCYDRARSRLIRPRTRRATT
jgi:hypothetical protein